VDGLQDGGQRPTAPPGIRQLLLRLEPVRAARGWEFRAGQTALIDESRERQETVAAAFRRFDTGRQTTHAAADPAADEATRMSDGTFPIRNSRPQTFREIPP
jgi:hypothetical protein